MADTKGRGVADTQDSSVTLNKIGFGSCSNQNKGKALLESVYQRLKKEKFDLWIWGGDAVYTRGSDLPALKLAYKQFKDDGNYERFASSVGRVVGTWDDHDLGKHVSN